MPGCKIVKPHCRKLSKGKASPGKSCTKTVKGKTSSGTRVHGHVSPKKGCGGSKTLSAIKRLQAIARGRAVRSGSKKRTGRSGSKSPKKRKSSKSPGRKSKRAKKTTQRLITQI